MQTDIERKVKQAAYDRVYRATPEYRVKLLAYYATPEYKIREKVRRVAHRDTILVQRKGYRIINHDDILTYSRTYNAGHRIERKVVDAAYRIVNKDKRAAYDAIHQKGRLEQRVLSAEKRRALLFGNTPVDELLTEPQWQAKLTEYNHRCAYCGCKLGYAKGDKHPTLDHVIPVSRGGKHSASNVAPACLHCNCSKNAKTPEEWIGLGIASVETGHAVVMRGRGGSKGCGDASSRPAGGKTQSCAVQATPRRVK